MPCIYQYFTKDKRKDSSKVIWENKDDKSERYFYLLFLKNCNLIVGFFCVKKVQFNVYQQVKYRLVKYQHYEQKFGP